MSRRWQNEAVAFVRDDPEFQRLARVHGKATAARIRIAEMMAKECDRLGDREGAARVRQQAKEIAESTSAPQKRSVIT
jgi:hypothetical protein